MLTAVLAKNCWHYKTRIEEHIKKYKSLIFLNIYTPPQHALNKLIDKANSKFDLKTKETLHVNCKKPNLNAQQNNLALSHFHYRLCHPFVSFYLCFFLSLLIYYFHISDTNFQHLLLP